GCLTEAKPVPPQVAHLLSVESGFVCFMFARKMTNFLRPHYRPRPAISRISAILAKPVLPLIAHLESSPCNCRSPAFVPIFQTYSSGSQTKRPQRRWRSRIGAAGGVTVAGANSPPPH